MDPESEEALYGQMASTDVAASNHPGASLPVAASWKGSGSFLGSFERSISHESNKEGQAKCSVATCD